MRSSWYLLQRLELVSWELQVSFLLGFVSPWCSQSLSQASHLFTSEAPAAGVRVFHVLQQPSRFDFFDLAAAIFRRAGIWNLNLDLFRICLVKCVFSWVNHFSPESCKVGNLRAICNRQQVFARMMMNTMQKGEKNCILIRVEVHGVIGKHCVNGYGGKSG